MLQFPKFKESVILTTGPNVLAATSELKTQGMKFPLLSVQNCVVVRPCVRLTSLNK